MDQVIARAAERAATVSSPWLLEVEDLHVHFVTTRGVVRAVEGISYKVKPGEVVALVGESGCGKSVSALAIMRLLARPAGRVVNGRIVFQGRNLLDLGEAAMRAIRGRDIAMIFQEPMTSLNAVLTVGFQLMEPLLIHLRMTPEAARARAVELLKRVGIPDPERRLEQYPHQFSGGMRQRAMIAIGLACNPRLLIADEPTTALDVTIQAQILELMKNLSRDLGVALVGPGCADAGRPHHVLVDVEGDLLLGRHERQHSGMTLRPQDGEGGNLQHPPWARRVRSISPLA